MNKYYYIPGESPYEKLKILDSDNNEISYKVFRKKYHESLSILNFNYPSELLAEGISSAAVLSFHRTKKATLIAQTIICGKDQSGRNIPITKILILKKGFNENELLEALKSGNPHINFPDYQQNINVGNIRTDFYLKNKSIHRVKDWATELEKNFKIIFAQILKNDQARSGKSVIFDRKEKSIYDSYIFYSKKKAPKYIAFGILFLFIISAIAYLLLNT